MDFEANLSEIVNRTTGAVACSLMGYDGIEIANVFAGEIPGEVDLPSLLVEYSNMLARLRENTEKLRTGALTEVAIHTETVSVVLRPVTETYFLALLLLPLGNFGMARYRLRVAAPLMAGELL